MIEEHFLHRFFNPRSIAVVGATQNAFTVNYHLVNNLVNLGYPGKIYPVNPKSDEVLGIKAFKTVADIDAYVDLVIISTPARSVPGIVRDLPQGKVGGVVIVTGGFSETGADGINMQDEIAGILRNKGIRAVGPNALSPVNSNQNFSISFFKLDKLPKGRISFIFQSGMYEPRFNWMLSDYHLGISKLLDLGNKMDINEVDALEYLAADPQTEAIFMHLEVVKGDGRKFLRLLRETTRRKPVIVLKGGRTEAGASAVISHTGSMVRGNEAVFDAVVKQGGAIKVDTLDDFLYFAKAFAYLDPPRGNRIAIATFPGGEAVLATDFLMQSGLVLAKPGQQSYERLKGTFPPWAIPLNPYDLGIVYTFHTFNNNHGDYIGAMADDDNVDMMAVQLTTRYIPIRPEDLCPPFAKARERGKPLAVWPPDMLRLDGDMLDYLENISIPVFPSAAITIKCLAALNRYRLISQAS